MKTLSIVSHPSQQKFAIRRTSFCVIKINEKYGKTWNSQNNLFIEVRRTFLGEIVSNISGARTQPAITSIGKTPSWPVPITLTTVG